MAWLEGLDCPCCGNKIDVTIFPGEKPVYYPNDKAHPGAPPEIEEIIGCECWDYLDYLVKEEGDRLIPAIELYDQQLWEEINDKAERRF